MIEVLLDKCDKLFLGGGMIFIFYKVCGLSVGKFLVENDKIELVKFLEVKVKEKGVIMLLFIDVVIVDKFDLEVNI